MKFAKKDQLKESDSKEYWSVLVVDDDESIHTVTSIVLEDFSFENKKLKLLNAYSAAEAKEILKNNSDIALVLLDIVMESDEAGLELVKYIRKELKNHEIRIVIRTGQPGIAPEIKVIQEYDINDYKEKTELTSIKLFTTIYSSIRSYRDIVNQKETLFKLQKQERLLNEQSKMAAMGEMMGNIAHQWRQPLAVISMWANNIIADIDMEMMDKTSLRKYANNINNQTKHLSQTIDDFRNFFTPNKDKTTFFLKSTTDRVKNLLSAIFARDEIDVIEEIEEIELTALENELMQALLNIIKNAKDILTTLEDSKKLLFINIYKKDTKAIIEIIDNGGGIDEKIIDKVFEPYFTTKHKSQGTGIGLYMTESIVTKHLEGRVYVENVAYSYENIDYVGAKFTIALPLD